VDSDRDIYKTRDLDMCYQRKRLCTHLCGSPILHMRFREIAWRKSPIRIGETAAKATDLVQNADLGVFAQPQPLWAKGQGPRAKAAGAKGQGPSNRQDRSRRVLTDARKYATVDAQWNTSQRHSSRESASAAVVANALVTESVDGPCICVFNAQRLYNVNDRRRNLLCNYQRAWHDNPQPKPCLDLSKGD
jgi:hypothetical protein